MNSHWWAGQTGSHTEIGCSQNQWKTLNQMDVLLFFFQICTNVLVELPFLFFYFILSVHLSFNLIFLLSANMRNSFLINILMIFAFVIMFPLLSFLSVCPFNHITIEFSSSPLFNPVVFVPSISSHLQMLLHQREGLKEGTEGEMGRGG